MATKWQYLCIFMKILTIMKTKIILLFSLVFLACSSMSQEKKKERTFGYFNRTEAGISFGIGSFKTDMYDGIRKSVRNNEIVFNFQTVNGITHKGRVGLGFGVGVEKWQHGLFFPLFGQLYYDLKPKGNTFFGTIAVGPQLEPGRAPLFTTREMVV